jgi:aldehyde:ferredoxin oxidoreductase
MSAFEGKMLEINLTNRTTRTSLVDKDVLRKFIGGSGLGAKLMLDRVDPKVDPLSPDNPLFILCGPTSGTTLPGGARFSVVTKSPLTNIFGESSCGGRFATDLRSAGWDGVIIEGASDKPVYLLIQDDKVEFKDAGDLWGKNVFEVTDVLQERHGDEKKGTSLTIGIAGENLVRFALIANEKRNFAARCGTGAVMGSKKLKAIFVKGSGKVAFADKDRFTSRRKTLTGKSKEHIAIQVLSAEGTNAALEISSMLGDLPAKNWALGDNSAIAAKIKGSILSGPDFLTGTKSCHGCMVGCKREVHITEGPYKGMEGPGPEYEGVATIGSLLMIGDMAAVIKLNEICGDVGVDVISCGSTIAMAMDCWEHGLISAKDTDGIELTWGNDAAVIQMVQKIARREGFGNVLAEGSKRAAQKIGGNASDYAVQVKGMEVPMHDPRANYLLGLSYATGVRGACHTNDVSYSLGSGVLDWPEFGLPAGTNVKQNEGAGEPLKNCQSLGQILGAAPFCYMTVFALNGEDVTELISAASGFDYTFEELKECAERIWHLKRGLDNLMGITAADDRLPRQILTPSKDGGAAGSAPDLEVMLKDFYPVRGLGPDGRPTKETLTRLGLNDLSAKLDATAIG